MLRTHIKDLLNADLVVDMISKDVLVLPNKDNVGFRQIHSWILESREKLEVLSEIHSNNLCNNVWCSWAITLIHNDLHTQCEPVSLEIREKFVKHAAIKTEKPASTALRSTWWGHVLVFRLKHGHQQNLPVIWSFTMSLSMQMVLMLKRCVQMVGELRCDIMVVSSNLCKTCCLAAYWDSQET